MERQISMRGVRFWLDAAATVVLLIIAVINTVDKFDGGGLWIAVACVAINVLYLRHRYRQIGHVLIYPLKRVLPITDAAEPDWEPNNERPWLAIITAGEYRDRYGVLWEEPGDDGELELVLMVSDVLPSFNKGVSAWYRFRAEDRADVIEDFGLRFVHDPTLVAEIGANVFVTETSLSK